jgi:hypothetical protein
VVGDRLELCFRRSEPERHGRQPQFVGGKPTQPLPIETEPHGARPGKHLDAGALRGGDQHVGGHVRRRRDDEAGSVLGQQGGEMLCVIPVFDGDHHGPEALERQLEFAARVTRAEQHNLDIAGHTPQVAALLPAGHIPQVAALLPAGHIPQVAALLPAGSFTHRLTTLPESQPNWRST